MSLHITATVRLDWYTYADLYLSEINVVLKEPSNSIVLYVYPGTDVPDYFHEYLIILPALVL